MKLNMKKIEAEMERRGWKAKELAAACGVSRQSMEYTLKAASIKGADRIAKALEFEPKDLLV
jgi:lambda repressor-like predicted transcriptional regulator